MFHRLRKKMRQWIPGIITGGADNDPAGITTYAVSGAQFGFGQLWLMVWATPMLIAVQAMCARLGAIKHKGLTSIIKEHYSPVFVIIAAGILVFANILTIGADLAGVSEAAGLVTNTNYIYWVVPIALLIWYIVVFKNFNSMRRYLLWLNFAFVAYIIASFLAKPNWGAVVYSLIVPSISFDFKFLLASVGLLGTTITPYLFFWQTQEEVEERKSASERIIESKEEDAILAPGFIFSNIISICIMIATATVLHQRGLHDISTAGQAALALEPFAGPFAKYLFGIGIIGAGLLAIPILAASASAAIAEVFGWRESLSDKLDKARGFYTIITASLLVGIAIALLRIDPIKALFYSQVVAGLLGPILIIMILFMCNDRKLMGTSVNRWFDNLFGWAAVVIMVLSNIGLFWQMFMRKT